MPAPDSGVSFAFSVQEFQEAVPLSCIYLGGGGDLQHLSHNWEPRVIAFTNLSMTFEILDSLLRLKNYTI